MNPEGGRIHRYRVEVLWDSEAGVWVASSDEVPGLVTEAQTLQALEAKLEHLVPELLLLNGVVLPGTAVETVWVRIDAPGLEDGADSVKGESGDE